LPCMPDQKPDSARRLRKFRSLLPLNDKIHYGVSEQWQTKYPEWNVMPFVIF
jgi:hypothetical protein